VGPLPAIPVAVRGRRLPDGTSEARVTVGAGRALLLRIVDDTIYVRAGTRWTNRGSASGIALDVGRELFDHPFLLEPTAAMRDGTDHLVELAAPPAPLRDYATNERHGPVTELLADATALTITGRVARTGTLVGDSFVLETTLPPGIVPGLAGRRARIEARTGYCPLRASDRTTVSVPGQS